MDDRISFLKHEGKEIIRVDYTDLRFEKLSELMQISKNAILKSGKKDILLLEVVTGVKIDSNTSSALKKYATERKPYLKKYSAVGIKGGTRVLLSTLRVLNIVMIEPFNTEEEAKKYLVK